MTESKVHEALERHDQATGQVRRCVLLSLVSGHPDMLIAEIDRFEKYFADHPEKVQPEAIADTPPPASSR